MATNRSRTDFLVVHSSATPSQADIGAEQIRHWHVNDNGWKDIGYHYVIRRDGAVEVGRNLREPGAHVRGWNHVSVGVCLVGGMDEQNVVPQNNYTPAQWDSLWDLMENLCEQFPDAQIRGHRDFPGVVKDCPCFDVQDWWIRTRIDDSRVSLRSRLAYHLRAVRSLIEDKPIRSLEYDLDTQAWDSLNLVAKMNDGAFDG